MTNRIYLTRRVVVACVLSLLLAPHWVCAAPLSPTAPVVRADNQFAFRLFHVLAASAKPDENVFVSPSSVALALAMTYNGAGGATRAAMARALGLQGLSLEQVNAGNAALQAALKAADPAVRLTIANDLWADTGTRFDPVFARNARRFYGAGVTTLPLDPGAAAIINRRISQETRGLIPDLLSPQDFTGPVHAVLTDAVYFHGPWSETFDKRNTQPGPFARPDGTHKTLPLMERTGEMDYRQGDGFQAVSLPYGRGRFVLDVLLPAPSSGLPRLLQSLDAAHWQTWTANGTSQRVNLTLPRFKVVVASDLKAPLSALGMGLAFSSHAEFRPMSTMPLTIDKVKHKALLDVDENGTTAAAATAVTMMPMSARPPFLPPVVMRVDRPFLCAIEDSGTGTILFLGAITDPQ